MTQPVGDTIVPNGNGEQAPGSAFNTVPVTLSFAPAANSAPGIAPTGNAGARNPLATGDAVVPSGRSGLSPSATVVPVSSVPPAVGPAPAGVPAAGAPVADTGPSGPATVRGTFSQDTRDKVGAAIQADTAVVTRPTPNLPPDPVLVQRQQQAWSDAKVSMSNDLSAQGNGKLNADKVVQPTVDAMNALAPGNQNLAGAVREVSDARNASWDAQGTTSGALARLDTAVASARANGAPQAWAPVADSVNKILNGGLNQGNQPPGQLPQDTAQNLKAQLDGRYPGDPQFATVSDAVNRDTTNRLTSLGLNDAQFAPTLQAADTARRAQADLDNTLRDNHLPPDLSPQPPQSPVGMMQQRVADAWVATSNAAQGQMRTAAGAADAAGATPQQRALAMNTATQMIGVAGPQDQDFQNATAFADWDLRVNQPTQAVQAALATAPNPVQGAINASQTLADQTAAAGDPRYAAMILDQSRPAVQQISQQAGVLAGPQYNDARKRASAPELQAVYANMSRAVEPANVMQETVQEAEAVRGAAQTMLDGFQRDGPDANSHTPGVWVADAVTRAVGGGNGAALSMSMASQADTAGRPEDTKRLVEGITAGLGALQQRTDGDVGRFADTAAGLSQIQDTWRGAMSPQQLDTALQGFQNATPQFGQQFAAVKADGLAAGQVASAWQNFGVTLPASGARDNLDKARLALTGQDTKVAGAIASSDWLSNNFWSNEAVKAGQRPDNSPVAYAGSATSVVKNFKGGAKTLYQMLGSSHIPVGKWIAAQSNIGMTTNPKVVGGISGIGTLIYGSLGTISAAQGDPVKSVYNYLGATKDTIEAYGRLSKNEKLAPLFANTMDAGAVSWKTAGWNGWGAAMSGVATVFDLQNAAKAGRQGDTFGQVTNYVAAGGDGLSAARGLVQFGSNTARVLGSEVVADTLGATALDAWAGPAAAAGGAIAFIASVASVGEKIYTRNSAINAESSQFLQDGLQIPKSAADILAPAASAESGPVLTAVAQKLQLTPNSLLKSLSTKDPAELRAFMDDAAQLATLHPDGTYPLSTPYEPPSKERRPMAALSIEKLARNLQEMQ